MRHHAMKTITVIASPVDVGILVVLVCCLNVMAVGIAAEALVVTSGPLRLEERLIMDKYAYPYGIAAADLDGDGDMDVTSADAAPHNALYWFENDGKGQFKRHYIQRDDPQRLERHAIGDIDGDGHLDVVIVKNLYGHLLWFRNSGKPRDGQLWSRHVVTTDLAGAYDVALADFDGDGDLDVVGSGWRLGNQFAWFENDGTAADGMWTKHLIETDLAETRMVRTGDLDGDGDPDIVGTATAARLILWYENPGNPATQRWERHVIDNTCRRPMHGQLIDIDGDGDLDLVLAIGMSGGADAAPSTQHEIAWYENDRRAPADAAWKKHVISRPFPNAIEAVAGDLDGDGDVDVAATGWSKPGQIAWFENHGDPKGRWTMHMIKDQWPHPNQVIVADFDGDGRPDIAACAEGKLEVRWWRNLGTTTK